MLYLPLSTRWDELTNRAEASQVTQGRSLARLVQGIFLTAQHSLRSPGNKLLDRASEPRGLRPRDLILERNLKGKSMTGVGLKLSL